MANRAAALLTESTGAVHEAAPQPLPRTATPDAARLAELERSVVRLRMAGLGDIVIALRPDLAATNAERFARLARDGYFDGLTFHRVRAQLRDPGRQPARQTSTRETDRTAGTRSPTNLTGAAPWACPPAAATPVTARSSST